MDARITKLHDELKDVDPRLASWVTICAGLGESYEDIVAKFKKAMAIAEPLRKAG